MEAFRAFELFAGEFLCATLPHAHYHHLKNHHSSLRSWLGQRWAGHEGTAQALRTIEEVQMDPLNVVARSHNIVLVSGYQPAYLHHLLYHARHFFDYGGGLRI